MCTGWSARPTRGDHDDISLEDGHRIDRFDSAEGSLEVLVKQSNWPLQIELDATGNTALGKGSRGYIPLYLNIEAHDIVIAPEKPVKWVLVLRASPARIAQFGLSFALQLPRGG